MDYYCKLCDKRTFETKAQAGESLGRYSESPDRSGKGRAAYLRKVYHCPAAGGFHIGHMTPEDFTRQRTRARAGARRRY